MLLLYNSKGNLAQLQREFKKIKSQLHDIVASTASQKCLAMFRTDDKCTEAVIMLRKHFLNLRKMAINHCRKKKLYILQKEIEKLENDYKIIASTNDNRLKSDVISNMATVVWAHLTKTLIDNDQLKVALSSFEIHHNKMFDLENKTVQFLLEVKRMQGNSQAYDDIKNKIASMMKLKSVLLNSFSFRSFLRTIRRLTN